MHGIWRAAGEAAFGFLLSDLSSSGLESCTPDFGGRPRLPAVLGLASASGAAVGVGTSSGVSAISVSSLLLSFCFFSPVAVLVSALGGRPRLLIGALPLQCWSEAWFS